MAMSPGVAQGAAYVLTCDDRSAVLRRELQPGELAGELGRLDEALVRAGEELVALRQKVGEAMGSALGDIFGAQTLILRDPSFRQRVASAIEGQRVNAEAALSDVVDSLAGTFDEIPDAYLRERAVDVRDVGRRLLAALDERSPGGLEIPGGAVVVARELLPSVSARLQLERVAGFVTERGGYFSHASILARSRGTPAVSGIAHAVLRIRTGDHLIVDGSAGRVHVNPPAALRREYQQAEAEGRAGKEALRQLAHVPAVTLDGASVALLANASKASDAEAALAEGAEGIGLFRTELAFALSSTLPSEDEQYQLVKRVAEGLHPRRVVLRLLDLGGDKSFPFFPLPASRNPSLAPRGIRLLLRHPGLLRSQLRAFLRVSADHPIAVLLPVVAGLAEVRETREVVRRVQEELAAEGEPFDRDVQIGAMIEVPSAALLVRALAREVDFFSLGTNDLVQYVLAADREDDRVPSPYQPLHPAVLRLVHLVVDSARRAGRELTICGDMAGNPLHAELLLGLGLRSFSVAPGELLELKREIRQLRLEDAHALACAALELDGAPSVEALVRERRSRRTAGTSAMELR